jgi:hypothetical protein
MRQVGMSAGNFRVIIVNDERFWRILASQRHHNGREGYKLVARVLGVRIRRSLGKRGARLYVMASCKKNLTLSSVTMRGWMSL